MQKILTIIELREEFYGFEKWKEATKLFLHLAEKFPERTLCDSVLQLDKTENEIFEDVKVKRKLIQDLSKTQRPKNLYDCNPNTFRKIQDYYTQTNNLLNEELNLSLPQGYYDFSFI